MKKGTFLAGVAALVLSLTPVAAHADSDYGVVNKLGMDITHLYVSASDEDNWGDDILGEDVLETGDECSIEFDPDDHRCQWDFKIIDAKGKSWTVKKVDLCKYTKVTFTRNGNGVRWSAR